MQYNKQVININVMVYYLELNNIYNTIETNLNIIKRFFAHYIPV